MKKKPAKTKPVATKSPTTLPAFLTTVTPFSKALAMILFITLPFVGFLLGMKFQKKLCRAGWYGYEMMPYRMMK